jgi:hypothetical protein
MSAIGIVFDKEFSDERISRKVSSSKIGCWCRRGGDTEVPVAPLRVARRICTTVQRSIQSPTFSLPFPQRNKRKEGIVVTASQFPGSRGSLFASGSFQRDGALGIKNGLRAGLECDPEDGAAVDGS